jgi:putative mRNA 3-end processing factor
LLGYSVGKTQRILSELIAVAGEGISQHIAVHGALLGPNEAYRCAGVKLPAFPSATALSKEHDWSKCLVFAPPSSQSTSWMKRFKDPSTAMASGWMAIRGTRRRRGVERGFILSDHIDWQDLLSAVTLYSPEVIWVTHGFSEITARYLSECGTGTLPAIPASVLQTKFAGEESEATLPAEDATAIEQTETH